MSGNKHLSMVLVGDVRINRPEPLTAFQHVRQILREGDFTFGNLEGAHADRGTPWVKEGSNWKCGAKQLAAVEDAGFDAMSVANNHAMDFGRDALIETIENLKRIGIAHTGGGRNFAEAYSPALVEKNGCKVALLGYATVYVRGWEARPDAAGIAVLRGGTAYEPPPRFFEGPGRPPIIHSWILQEDKAQLARLHTGEVLHKPAHK